MGSKKGQKVTISGEEYCDLLADFIHEYYNRIISDDEVFLALKLDKPSETKFTLELSIVLGIISLRLFSIKHNNDGLKAFTRARILEKIEHDIFDFNGKDKDNYEDLFDQRFNMFFKLIPEQKSSYEVRSQFLGFSRYMISQFSNKTEDENKDIITKISTHIVEFGDVTSRYMANSKIKVSSALTGKYEYVITM